MCQYRLSASYCHFFLLDAPILHSVFKKGIPTKKEKYIFYLGACDNSIVTDLRFCLFFSYFAKQKDCQ
jgi:hypothetical protein